MFDFEYTIVRSNRRSLGITVKGGKVVVRAPLRISEERILEMLKRQSDWIVKKISAQNADMRKYASVKQYRTVLILGTEKKLIADYGQNIEKEDALCLKNISCLRKWMEKNYSDLIYERVFCLGKTVGAMPSELQVRDFKAKWGSCDAQSVIKINWRVLFLSPELQDYIYIHELCHLKFLNHSALFWAEVAQFCPNYKILRKELKGLSFLTDLYRK